MILVNTCAIREHAEQRVIGRLGELKRHMGPQTILGVTGCMAQRLGPVLLERASHVSLVIGPDGYGALPALLDGARRGMRATATEFDLDEHYEDVRPRRVDGVKAWVRSSAGVTTDAAIASCRRRAARSGAGGWPRSCARSREVVAAGMTEVVLLGQTVNSYTDGTHDFADLVRAVGAVPGVRRLRFQSRPNDFSDRVIAALADVPAVCEHVHLPMQSGSDRTLKRMLRRYTREGYLQCVDRLRDAIPTLALTTDVIVGFPGEGEADFADTLSAVRAVGFDDAYTFKFSPRAGTAATRLPPTDAVPDEVASERLTRLIETVRAGTRERNMGLLAQSTRSSWNAWRAVGTMRCWPGRAISRPWCSAGPTQRWGITTGCG